MHFNVRNICGDYQEMTVDAIETGTMDKREATRLAQEMISAAEDLLHGADLPVASDSCGRIVQDLAEYL